MHGRTVLSAPAQVETSKSKLVYHATHKASEMCSASQAEMVMVVNVGTIRQVFTLHPQFGTTCSELILQFAFIYIFFGIPSITQSDNAPTVSPRHNTCEHEIHGIVHMRVNRWAIYGTIDKQYTRNIRFFILLFTPCTRALLSTYRISYFTPFVLSYAWAYGPVDTSTGQN
jgi:hypothetical protein